MNNVIGILAPLISEILLIICGAFFAATETAYTSISRIKVKTMIKEGAKNAKKVSFLRANLERLISTVLIGTNVITTFASALATSFAVKIFGSEYVTYVTALMSILIIIFMEIIPKTYAGARPEVTAQHSANIIIILQKIFFPLIYVFDEFTKLLNTIEKALVKKERPLVTEDELKTLIDVGGSEGTLEADEKKMLERIFEFSDLQVKDIMRHRSLVKYIKDDADINEVIQAFASSGYSRIPVYHDTFDNVVGVIHYKSVLFANQQIIKSKDFVKICCKQPLFVPETMTLVELLRIFKKEKSNFALTVNEYGGTSGIATVTDVLREVFGRMTDEYGNAGVSPEKRVTVVGTNEFLIPGDMKLDELNDVLNISIDSENFDTLGGWLLERFGELPSIGAIYKANNIMYIVEDQSSRRIQTVRLRFIAK